MSSSSAFLADAGLRGLPAVIEIASTNASPLRVAASLDAEARVMGEFREASLDRFRLALRRLPSPLGLDAFEACARALAADFGARSVRLRASFVLPVSKAAPVSGAPAWTLPLSCAWNCRWPSLDEGVRTTLSVACPAVASFAVLRDADGSEAVFPRTLTAELEVQGSLVPAELSALVDSLAAAPAYPFFTQAEAASLARTAPAVGLVDLADALRAALAAHPGVRWYSLRVREGSGGEASAWAALEKSRWVPGSSGDA